VTLRAVAFGMMAAGLGVLASSGAALARNPHCAGGIQYVVQGMRDKDKGNLEDYAREMNKAVAQLEMCRQEDPGDIEALGYLGWAYAELDSARQAGEAFDRAIAGFTAKGDKKKLDWVTNNRDAYWAKAFNDAIAKIQSAQEAYPEFTRAPENEADETLKQEARKRYDEALASLALASGLRPDHPQTLRSLGSVYAFMGEFQKAAEVFQRGLTIAPADTSLMTSMKSVRSAYASQLIREKRYDEALTYFESLAKTSPNDADVMVGLADAHFNRARALEGDARKPEFEAAGDAYARAAALRTADADLAFNAALAFQNAGNWVKAETQWRKSLAARPNDVDALSALAATLAELKKFDEAVTVLQQAIAADPRNKTLHRQLGAVYTKAQNNAKATQELMVFLALQNGEAVANPDSAAKSEAKAGGDPAKVLASAGVPEQLIPWEADSEKYQSWFYWSKGVAYHFKGTAQVVKSEWSTAKAKSTLGVGAAK